MSIVKAIPNMITIIVNHAKNCLYVKSSFWSSIFISSNFLGLLNWRFIKQFCTIRLKALYYFFLISRLCWADSLSILLDCQIFNLGFGQRLCYRLHAFFDNYNFAISICHFFSLLNFVIHI